MAVLERMRVTWTGGGVIGGGVSTFYFSQPTGANPGAVRTFFGAAPLLFPASVTIQVPNGGDMIESTTGALVGTWSVGSTPAPVVGTNAGDFALGVGMQVRWGTDGIVGGRRVVGSTFLVPIAAAIFDVDGTIDNASVSSVLSAANALITAAPNLQVWSRPKPGRAGTAHDVVRASVPDRPSWLRSRRK